METVENYTVKWAGLTNGTHDFHFHGGTSFFDEEFLSFNAIDAADISFDVQMIKEDWLLQFDIHMSGTIGTLCDHCGGVLELPVDGTRKLIARPGSIEKNNDGEDVFYFTEDSRFIDLFQYMYETAVLNLPLRKLHKEGRCDNQMLSQLSHSSETALQQTDPRWEALKALKNK